MPQVDFVPKAVHFNPIVETATQDSTDTMRNGISTRVIGVNISSHEMTTLIGGSTNPPRAIGDLMFLSSQTANKFSDSNLPRHSSDSSIFPVVAGLEVPETSFNDSQKAVDLSAFSNIVTTLEVRKGFFFGGSHKTKIQANCSAVDLREWAQKANVKTMPSTVENFVKDMKAVIVHKLRTNGPEALKLQGLAMRAIESAVDHAKQNIRETTAFPGGHLLRELMEKDVEAALDTAKRHGFSSDATLAFMKRDDIKFN